MSCTYKMPVISLPLVNNYFLWTKQNKKQKKTKPTPKQPEQNPSPAIKQQLLLMSVQHTSALPLWAILKSQPLTVLGQFGRRKLCGDWKGLFGAALENETGRNIGAAVVVLFAAGQPQVERVVIKRAVLITLQTQGRAWHVTWSIYCIPRTHPYSNCLAVLLLIFWVHPHILVRRSCAYHLQGLCVHRGCSV